MNSRSLLTLLAGQLLLACAASCSHSPSNSPPFPVSAPDDWGKIKWGTPVDGLQLGIVYSNAPDGLLKSGANENLIIDVYLRNCGKRVIYLLRPEA